MSELLTLVVYLRAKPGKEEELGQRLMALVAPTKAEAGCFAYELHRSNDDPQTWMLYESWKSRADLDLHLQMPYLKDFFGVLDELLREDMTMHFFTAVPAQQVALAPA
ncbi:putative quinol monooxygenase [Dyella silvatica]|uniref:putative quinol monooxygenase n=1 Tax=Dyella silvatica TaxID=2992128 RepID=UPI0022537C0E|nr:putative quinol monooxygenase [Dyella silvatica]